MKRKEILVKEKAWTKVHAFFGAGYEGRTRDIQLGRLTLYQLSYSRGQE